MRGYSQGCSRYFRHQKPNLLKSGKSLKDLAVSEKTIKLSASKKDPKTANFSYNQYETIHYVKIPIEDLSSELAIYDWRKTGAQGIIPIKDFKLVSAGNILNPHALIKVVIGKTSKAINISENITLSKTMSMLEEASKIAQILINKFGPFEFTDQKIILGEDEEKLQIWPLQKVWINPSNYFYAKPLNQGSQITEKTTILSLLSIFEDKSLKTKLASEFFAQTKKSRTISEFFLYMEKFQKNHNIFQPKKLKESKLTLSTGIQKSSRCLEFSIKSNRKKIPKCERPSSELSPFRSLREFYQTNNSFAIQKWERASDTNYQWNVRSTLRISPEMTRQNSVVFLNPEDGSKKCQQTSFVVSQVFKDDENTDAATPTVKMTALSKNSFASDISWGDQKYERLSIPIPPKIPEQLQASQQKSIKIDSKVLQKSRKQLVRSQFLEQQEQETKNPFEMILRSNGWSNNISGLTDSPTKQSFCDGTIEENIFLRGLQLNHLRGLGRDIGKSMMPVQQDSFQQN